MEGESVMAKSKTGDFIAQCGYSDWNRKETVKLLNRYYQWFNLKEQNTFEQQEKYLDGQVDKLKTILKLKRKQTDNLIKQNEILKLEIQELSGTAGTLKKSLDLMSAEKGRMLRKMRRLEFNK